MFRPARSQDDRRNVLATALQTLVIWGMFLMALPWWITELECHLNVPLFEPVPVAGIAGFLLFGTLGVWSGYTMSRRGKGTPLPIDCPNQLVVAGPYAYVRNPMAVAGIG